MVFDPFLRFKLLSTKERRRKLILKQLRNDQDIVFGARSLEQSIGLFARQTQDFDAFTKNPKKSAEKLQKKLDMLTGKDHFFAKKGLNVTTWKVKSKGHDQIKGTRDDLTIADFTRTPKPSPKYFIKKGIRFRVLDEEIAAKKKIVKDPEFKFRRKKDLDDLKRISLSQPIKL